MTNLPQFQKKLQASNGVDPGWSGAKRNNTAPRELEPHSVYPRTKCQPRRRTRGGSGVVPSKSWIGQPIRTNHLRVSTIKFQVVYECPSTPPGPSPGKWHLHVSYWNYLLLLIVNVYKVNSTNVKSLRHSNTRLRNKSKLQTSWYTSVGTGMCFGEHKSFTQILNFIISTTVLHSSECVMILYTERDVVLEEDIGRRVNDDCHL